MKKLLLGLLTLLCSLPAAAQVNTTAVTINVTDTPDVQVWVAGSYATALLINPGTSTATSSPGPTGALDGNGNASFILTSQNDISFPTGGQWQVTVCPQMGCAVASYSYIFPSVLGSNVSANLTPPSFRQNVYLGKPTNAYRDSEIISSTLGSLYFNTTISCLKFCAALPCINNWNTITSTGGGGGGGGSFPNFLDTDVPTGLVNSSNVTFTLTQVPNPSGSLLLFRNGVLLKAGGVDYSLASATITFNTAPITGDTLQAFYRYAGTSAASAFSDSEIPSGAVNSSNVTFTIAHSPSPTTSLQFYRNGLALKTATDYTITGPTVTLVAAPITGDVLETYYRYVGTGASPNFSDSEVPAGAVNSSNVTFTLASVPNPTAGLRLYRNGVLQTAGSDFTLISSTLTFTAAPLTGDILEAYYRF